MGLAYYLEDAAGHAKCFSLPPGETIPLLKALYLKREAFRKKATFVILCENIFEEGNSYRNNIVTLKLGDKSYCCDEYTYFNKLISKFKIMDYSESLIFEKRYKKLTLDKYKSFSRPLSRIPGKSELIGSIEKDTGYSDGYLGYDLNYFGCLLKLIEDTPENTLIECKTRIQNRIVELFRFYGDCTPEFQFVVNKRSLEGYTEAEEYETFVVIAEKIIQLCDEKNIYFDINPYNELIMHKKPVETWTNTYDAIRDRRARYNYTKYESTYIDDHIEFHEEAEPVEIVSRTLVSDKHFTVNPRRGLERITYDVVYIDGVHGQIVTERGYDT